jgi:hypothetical protein
MKFSFAHPKDCSAALRTFAACGRLPFARPDRTRILNLDGVAAAHAVAFDGFYFK